MFTSFAVKSFTELGPQLLQQPDVKYLLSEVFSQDPLEKYFSRQRHRGGGADNPTVEEFRHNTATLIQQAFGPDSTGPNILVDDTLPSEVRMSMMYVVWDGRVWTRRAKSTEHNEGQIHVCSSYSCTPIYMYMYMYMYVGVHVHVHIQVGGQISFGGRGEGA